LAILSEIIEYGSGFWKGMQVMTPPDKKSKVIGGFERKKDAYLSRP
jgi:hypothetical protein